MYICVCKAITDKQVEETTKTCSSIQEACKKLGVGSECGSCLEDTIAKHLKQQNDKQPKSLKNLKS